MILNRLDYFLDRITMYRLVLYYLIAILLVALGLSGFKLLPYTPVDILGSTLLITIICALSNLLFSKVYNAPTNLESTYITALILACILPPLHTASALPLLIWAPLLSIGSKYILAIRGKHLFNPAALAVVLTALWLNQPATWWISTAYIAPIVIIGGILMVRKLRRTTMVVSFLLVTLTIVTTLTIINGHDPVDSFSTVLLRTPLFFFGFIMLTEPLTSPPSRIPQALYGGLVGLLFAPQVHIGTLYFTPELALLVGNVFSYFVSPKIRERLTLTETKYLAPDVVEFSFQTSRRFNYQPGQYMEFTLPHSRPDQRGTRRYFTLSSSPTEEDIKLGIKFYPKPSTFKSKLVSLPASETLMAGQLAGEFTLPKDPTQKLTFIAGGIGITPFRSMVKYLLDKQEFRPITLLYMNKTVNEIVYTEVFEAARSRLGINTIYVLSDTSPEGWPGRSGRIDEEMIRQEVPDFMEHIFYISGPHMMVVALEGCLKNLGVAEHNIKKDFFPGLT